MSDPLRVSPSRIGTFADCGEQYRLKYIEGLPAGKSGSAALFGKVMHRAREDWVLDRGLSLVSLVEKAWKLETEGDPVIGAFLERYSRLSKKAIQTEYQIKQDREAQGRPVKVVRMTKDWKESDVARQIESLMREWLSPLNENSNYRFTERDPLPALYDESLVLAAKYSHHNKHRPTAYVTEFAFDFVWKDEFQLNGYIDEICPLIDPETGVQFGVGVIDAKTYRMIPKHGAKDWRQLIIYTLALEYYKHSGVLELPDLPIYQGIDRMRFTGEDEAWAWYQLGDVEKQRLLRELKMFKRGLDAEVFIPASKTCNADWCDWSQHCIFFHGTAAQEVELNVA